MGLIHSLLSTIFPSTCSICGCALVEGENALCLDCLSNMPRLTYHLQPEHPFVRRMAAMKFQKVAAMFAYVKHDDYAKLIQNAKYNHQPYINRSLAREFASELGKTFFADVDIILPVPMHWIKRFFRGYNQTDYIARGLSDITGIPVGNNLVAIRGHATQTRRNAQERLSNTSDIFDVITPEELQGKHILIVDDVITTGATLMSCADVIRAAQPNASISCLALASARLN